MGIADERIEKIRLQRHSEHSFTVYDYNVRFFFIGWALFLSIGYISFWAFGYGSLSLLMKILGRPEELAQVMYAYIAVIAGCVGYLFGHLVSFIILRHLGKRWQGNLHFGKHPAFFIALVSWITFNICFLLVASVIASFL